MFSDTKMMADVISHEGGRLTCVVSVSQKGKGRARRNLFQPLSMLELTIEERRAGALPVVKDAHIAEPLATLHTDPRKISISMFVAEFLYNVTRQEENGGLLFCYVRDSLLWLDTVEQGFANFHLVFMMRLTRFVGFFPNLDDYADHCFFDMRNGCFTLTRPVHSDVLPPDDARKVSLLMRMDYSTMHLFQMSRQERNRCADVILHFYSLHVPSFGDMKSLEVLRELF